MKKFVKYVWMKTAWFSLQLPAMPVRFLAAALVFAALSLAGLSLTGCESPTNPGTETPGTETPGTETPAAERFRDLEFVSDEPVRGTPGAAAGARAGIFQTKGAAGTAVYSFEDGRNGEFLDNDYFEIRGSELYIIKTTPLAEGQYKIRVKATDGEGKVLLPDDPFVVEVFGLPGKPIAIEVIAGQRRLYISWNHTSGASSYEYCIGTAADFAAPAAAASIFAVSGDFVDSFGTETWRVDTGLRTALGLGRWLADATQYYVRVRAKNQVGTGEWSNAIAADSPTGDPIQAFWYTGKYDHLLEYINSNGAQGAYPAYSDYKYPGGTVIDGNGVTQTIAASDTAGQMGWDCGMDPYVYRALADGKGVQVAYLGPFAASGDDAVIYHKRFTPQQSSQPVGLLPDGVTPGEAGVFVTRSSNGYYCNYYWGLGAMISVQENIPGGWTRPPWGTAENVLPNIQVKQGWGAGGSRKIPLKAAKEHYNVSMSIEIRGFPARWYRRTVETTQFERVPGWTGCLPAEW